jgi:hypothetical protein
MLTKKEKEEMLTDGHSLKRRKSFAQGEKIGQGKQLPDLINCNNENAH